MNVLKGLVLLLSVSILAQPQVPTASDSDRVTFELLINIDYDDSDESLASVDEFLAFRLAEAVSAPDKAALEDFMFQRYQFGPSALPKTFARLRSEVASLNANRKDGERWLIPALPRRRSTKRDPSNPFHSLPRVATYDCVRAENNVIEVEQRGSTEEDMRRGSALTLVQVNATRAIYAAIPLELKELSVFRGLTSQLAPIQMPREQVRVAPALLPSAPTERLAAARASFDPALAINVSAAVGAVGAVADPDVAYAPVPAPAVVAPPPRITFRDFLARGGYQPPARADKVSYLLVLDDGWPNETAMLDSFTFVEAAINSRRARYKLDPIKIARPAVTPSFKNHAAQVEQAIAAIRKTDSDKRVHVIYIPILLNADSEPLAREIIRTGWLMRRAEPQMILAKPVTPLEKPAATFADDSIAEWKEQTRAARAANLTCDGPGNAKVDCFHTDGFLLNSIYKLTESIAEQQNTVFVVNQSWTVRGDTLTLLPTARSLTVSATGNDGLDVIAFNVDFARQSLQSDKFLAVMFLDNSYSPDCGSGTIGTDTNEKEPWALQARAVGFDGDLDDGHCGTSFASPRVAWLIAAKANPGQSSPAADWQTRVQRLIRNSRYGDKTLWKDIYFDPLRFWQSPLQ